MAKFELFGNLFGMKKGVITSGDLIGRTLIINNKRIIVDGKVISEEAEGVIELKVTEGVLENVNASCSVSCGEVMGNVSAGMDVTCGNVGGKVDAKMAVSCSTVGGNVKAGMSVDCGDVSGDVEAGMSVTAKTVSGSTKAKM